MLARPLYPKLPVWSLMSLAAFLAIFIGPVTVDDVAKVVNFEVVFFLVGMFTGPRRVQRLVRSNRL